MCYNENASWIAFTVGMVALNIAIIKAIENKDKEQILLALSFIPIVIIQLYEALLYKEAKICENIENNRYTFKVIRKILLFTICLQPIALYVGGIQHKEQKFSPHLRKLCGILIAFYIISLIIDYPTIEEGKRCGKWKFKKFNKVSGILYHIVLLLSLMIPQKGGTILFSVGLISFILSLFMGENQPSKWCILAAFTPICLLLNEKNKKLIG